MGACPRARFQSSQQLLQQCRPKQKTPLKTPQSPKVKSSRARLRSQCCPRRDLRPLEHQRPTRLFARNRQGADEEGASAQAGLPLEYSTEVGCQNLFLNGSTCLQCLICRCLYVRRTLANPLKPSLELPCKASRRAALRVSGLRTTEFDLCLQVYQPVSIQRLEQAAHGSRR